MTETRDHPPDARPPDTARERLNAVLDVLIIVTLSVGIVTLWFLATVGGSLHIGESIPTFALFALDAFLSLFAALALGCLFAMRPANIMRPANAMRPVNALAGACAFAVSGVLTAMFVNEFPPLAEGALIAAFALFGAAIAATLSAARGESRKRPSAVRALGGTMASPAFKLILWLASVAASLAAFSTWSAIRFFARDGWTAGLLRILPDSALDALLAMQIELPLLAMMSLVGAFVALPIGARGETPFAVRALGEARKRTVFKVVAGLAAAAFLAFAASGVVAYLTFERGDEEAPEERRPNPTWTPFDTPLASARSLPDFPKTASGDGWRNPVRHSRALPVVEECQTRNGHAQAAAPVAVRITAVKLFASGRKAISGCPASLSRRCARGIPIPKRCANPKVLIASARFGLR